MSLCAEGDLVSIDACRLIIMITFINKFGNGGFCASKICLLEYLDDLSLNLTINMECLLKHGFPFAA